MKSFSNNRGNHENSYLSRFFFFFLTCQTKNVFKIIPKLASAPYIHLYIQ